MHCHAHRKAPDCFDDLFRFGAAGAPNRRRNPPCHDRVILIPLMLLNLMHSCVPCLVSFGRSMLFLLPSSKPVFAYEPIALANTSSTVHLNRGDDGDSDGDDAENGDDEDDHDVFFGFGRCRAT